MLIISLILFFGCFALLAYFMWTGHVEAVKSVVPGAKFVYKQEGGNPFLDDGDYRYVVEVKNGWVRYKLGKNGAPIHTAKIGDFIAYKEFVENT